LSLSDYGAILLPVAISCCLFFPPKFTPFSTQGWRTKKKKTKWGRMRKESEFPLVVGFDTSNNLLGFRLKSYR